MKRVIFIFLFIVLLLSACACESNPPARQSSDADEQQEAPTPTAVQTPDPEVQIKNDIAESIAAKQKAIDDNDLNLYLSTISDENEYYYNEQRRWFYEITNETISDVSLELLGVEIIDSETAIASVNQKHFHDEQFDFDFELLYEYKNGQWVDCDYPFLIKEYDGFILKYQPDETKVMEFAALIQKSRKTIAEEFDMQMDDQIEIKMFIDRELLRQRTIPTSKRLFTGWGEADESIKFYSGFEDVDRYYSLFLHEFTHHVTMKMCNNNLPEWFAEGLAVSYGTFVAEEGNCIDNGKMDKEALKVDINWLQDFDNRNETEEALIDAYYYASGMFVEFLRDLYGQQTVADLLYKAGEKPYNESIFNDEFTAMNKQTLLEVLEYATGQSIDELSEEYIQWIDQY